MRTQHSIARHHRAFVLHVGGWTYKRIGDEMGITRERVRQMHETFRRRCGIALGRGRKPRPLAYGVRCRMRMDAARWREIAEIGALRKEFDKQTARRLIVACKLIIRRIDQDRLDRDLSGKERWRLSRYAEQQYYLAAMYGYEYR